MSDFISRKALGETMYEEVFLKDSDDQRWDSGCWIRYKLFEQVVDSIPTIDAVPVVRCKDCKYRDTFECGMQTYEYDDDTDLRKVYDWTKDDGFCYWGESKDDEQ